VDREREREKKKTITNNNGLRRAHFGRCSSGAVLWAAWVVLLRVWEHNWKQLVSNDNNNGAQQPSRDHTHTHSLKLSSVSMSARVARRE